jgi:drug/metabolite transporter (DMT)-like permease
MRSVIFWMTGALASFVAAALAVRELSSIYNIFEIGMMRTGGGLIMLLTALLVRPDLRNHLVPRAMFAHVPRNLAHAFGGMLWTLAIAMLPLATVFSLEFTAPAWAAILAYFILGERVTHRAILGILINLLGVAIILRPAPMSFDVVSLLPLAAAICFAVSIVLTRRLALRDSVFAILFWMMIIQLPIYFVGWLTLPITAAVSGPTFGLAGPATLALAIAGLSSQFCLSMALRIGDTVQVVTLDFLRIPLIAIIGWSFYSEPFDIWVLIGSAIIIVGINIGLTPPRAIVGQAP